MNTKALAKFSIFIVFASLLLVSIYSIPLISSEAETPTGKITIGNTAPTAPTVLGVQDTSDATVADTATPDTHMIYSDFFNISWTGSTDANSDPVFYRFCVASSSANRNAENCDIINKMSDVNALSVDSYATTGSDTGLVYSGASVTYYTRVIATDKQGTSENSTAYDASFAIVNAQPSCAGVTALTFGASVGETHQTTVAGLSPAKIDWADCTDADTAGTADHYPADVLVYDLQIGDSASGGIERTMDDNLASSEKTTAYNATNLVFGTSVASNTWVNKTYYFRVTADDQQGTTNSVSANADGDFKLFNRVPSVASAWDTAETHDNTPSVSYTGGTDADTDSVTCHIIAGNPTTADAIITEADAKTGVSSATFWDKTIPWNTTEQTDGGWSNYTASMTIWCVDDKTPTLWYNTNANYTATMILYDNLPDITKLEIADAGEVYADCSSSCSLLPVEGTNATVAVRVTFEDTDSDCTSGHNVFAHFCYNTTTGQACTEVANNVSYSVNSISGASTTCVAVFSANKTASDGTPQFWINNAVYKIHLNATSQSGIERTTDAEKDGTWLYNTLRSISYPSTLMIGGSPITFYAWNTNTTTHDAVNIGNHPLNLTWNMTNPTCSPESSATCGSDVWTLNGTDFRLDDDSDPLVDTSNQPYIDLAVFAPASAPEFDHTGIGLVNCNIYSCATPTNATLNTYFHIAPPSLRAGTYNATFIITLRDYS